LETEFDRQTNIPTASSKQSTLSFLLEGGLNKTNWLGHSLILIMKWEITITFLLATISFRFRRLSKCCFSDRIIPLRNNLLQIFVSDGTVNSFKAGLENSGLNEEEVFITRNQKITIAYRPSLKKK